MKHASSQWEAIVNDGMVGGNGNGNYLLCDHQALKGLKEPERQNIGACLSFSRIKN